MKKSKEKNIILKQMHLKGKDFRVEILLLCNSENEKAFFVSTKRLNDFKTRSISTSLTYYSVETFAILKELFGMFLNNPEIKNKILLKELSKIKTSQVYTDLED